MKIIHYTAILLALIGFFAFTVGYLIWTWIKLKIIPTSYSATYGLNEGKNNKGFIFTSWAGFQSYCRLLGIALNSMSPLKMILGVGSLFSLLIVGRKPTSVSKRTTFWHCLFAKICAVDAILWLFLNGLGLPTAIICAIGFAYSRLCKPKYETLIMEFVAFMCTDIGIVYLELQALGVI